MSDNDDETTADGSNRVTIYEVARRAGVSIATVSHAINRPERVAPGTRDRVLDVIDDLGFVPKQTAVSLARKGVGRIGVLAPFTSYRTYHERLDGVLQACASSNVDVVVFDAPSPAAATSPLLRTLPTSGRLDGLLIMGLPLEDATASRLARRKMAISLVDSQHKDFHSVNVDDEAGGFALGTHLVERGHQQIAFVSEEQKSADYVSSGQLRLRGFVGGLEAGGLPGDSLHWVLTSNSLQGGYEAAAQVLKLDPAPTAVFGHNDVLAAGLLAGLRAAGRRVPEDIAVVGYDGTDLAEALEITTVAQPFAETGRVATSLLLTTLDGSTDSIRHIDLQPELIIRSTS